MPFKHLLICFYIKILLSFNLIMNYIGFDIDIIQSLLSFTCIFDMYYIIYIYSLFNNTQFSIISHIYINSSTYIIYRIQFIVYTKNLAYKYIFIVLFIGLIEFENIYISITIKGRYFKVGHSVTVCSFSQFINYPYLPKMLLIDDVSPLRIHHLTYTHFFTTGYTCITRCIVYY